MLESRMRCVTFYMISGCHTKLRENNENRGDITLFSDKIEMHEGFYSGEKIKCNTSLNRKHYYLNVDDSFCL